MREIKFKAVMQRHDNTMYVSESYSIDSGLSYLFDFENNRWDRFLEMITTEERFVKLFPDDDEYLNGWSHIENIQYTGLKDKNGLTEIYEGDIILWRNSDGELVKDRVVFCKGAFRMRNMSFTLYDYMDSNVFEVIGNVYEHSHLLLKDK